MSNCGNRDGKCCSDIRSVSITASDSRGGGEDRSFIINAISGGGSVSCAAAGGDQNGNRVSDYSDGGNNSGGSCHMLRHGGV